MRKTILVLALTNPLVWTAAVLTLVALCCVAAVAPMYLLYLWFRAGTGRKSRPAVRPPWMDNLSEFDADDTVEFAPAFTLPEKVVVPAAANHLTTHATRKRTKKATTLGPAFTSAAKTAPKSAAKLAKPAKTTKKRVTKRRK